MSFLWKSNGSLPGLRLLIFVVKIMNLPVLSSRYSSQKYKVENQGCFLLLKMPLSRHLYSRVKELYKNSPDIFILRTRRFRTHTVYRLEFTHLLGDEMKNILKKMGISLIEDGEKISYEKIDINNRCCKRAYLRGCFLANGSISDPDRSYHLEITFPNLLLPWNVSRS